MAERRTKGRGATARPALGGGSGRGLRAGDPRHSPPRGPHDPGPRARAAMLPSRRTARGRRFRVGYASRPRTPWPFAPHNPGPPRRTAGRAGASLQGGRAAPTPPRRPRSRLRAAREADARLPVATTRRRFAAGAAAASAATSSRASGRTDETLGLPSVTSLAPAVLTLRHPQLGAAAPHGPPRPRFAESYRRCSLLRLERKFIFSGQSGSFWPF